MAKQWPPQADRAYLHKLPMVKAQDRLDGVPLDLSVEPKWADVPRPKWPLALAESPPQLGLPQRPW